MVPAGVHAFVGRGHEVLVEKGAGNGSGIEDADFVAAGAQIVPDAGLCTARPI
jgi:alanine dehydrogenase